MFLTTVGDFNSAGREDGLHGWSLYKRVAGLGAGAKGFLSEILFRLFVNVA